MKRSTYDIIQKGAPHLLEGSVHAGDSFNVLCPFHDERTPSCNVPYNKAVFFCHGCKESGHIKKLLKKAGVSEFRASTLTEQLSANARPTARERLQRQLRRARNPYSAKTFISDTVLDDFRTGGVPGQLLTRFSLETINFFDVGVDTKRDRITFPIRDLQGKLIGISGRATIEGEIPRYKIYRQELIQDYGLSPDYSIEDLKKRTFWNGHNVLRNGKPKPYIVVVEGFKAAMAVWQAGHKDVVALIGSYMTPAHANLLAYEWTDIVLFLDNDEAGLKGTDRAISLMKHHKNVRVVLYDDEIHQPDDLSDSEIDDAISHAVDANDWRMLLNDTAVC